MRKPKFMAHSVAPSISIPGPLQTMVSGATGMKSSTPSNGFVKCQVTLGGSIPGEILLHAIGHESFP